jgi:hypothetical protein
MASPASSVTPASAPAPKKSPWGAVVKAPAAVSLASIQREEQTHSDIVLATKLQIAEEVAVLGPEAAGACEGVMDDAELAAMLQREEEIAAGLAPAPPMNDDEALAAALQAEFDEEHERSITALEKKANQFTNGYVSSLVLIICRAII